MQVAMKVDEGVKQLVRAEQHQKNSRLIICIMFLIVACAKKVYAADDSNVNFSYRSAQSKKRRCTTTGRSGQRWLDIPRKPSNDVLLRLSQPVGHGQIRVCCLFRDAGMIK